MGTTGNWHVNSVLRSGLGKLNHIPQISTIRCKPVIETRRCKPNTLEDMYNPRQMYMYVPSKLWRAETRRPALTQTRRLFLCSCHVVQFWAPQQVHVDVWMWVFVRITCFLPPICLHVRVFCGFCHCDPYILVHVFKMMSSLLVSIAAGLLTLVQKLFCGMLTRKVMKQLQRRYEWKTNKHMLINVISVNEKIYTVWQLRWVTCTCRLHATYTCTGTYTVQVHL